MVDVVSQPTPQYHDMFLSGDLPSDLNYPAMCTTHHAASKFCQWLTAQTGHFYRLPTEAEWEYACRAGSTTAFHFGDEVKQLDDYAWHGYNSEYMYHPVAKKKPNQWGLYDMHGNVAEWVLDGFTEDYRDTIKPGTLNPWNIPITQLPADREGRLLGSGPGRVPQFGAPAFHQRLEGYRSPGPQERLVSHRRPARRLPDCPPTQDPPPPKRCTSTGTPTGGNPGATRRISKRESLQPSEGAAPTLRLFRGRTSGFLGPG